jgi:hypothetical protein
MTKSLLCGTLIAVALGAVRAEAGQAAPAPVWAPLPAPFVPEPPDIPVFDADLKMLDANLKMLMAQLPPQPPLPPKAPAPAPLPPGIFALENASDRLYRQGREQIDAGRYERAIPIFERLIGQESERADAALYWKAYSLSKISKRDDALAALADLQKRFARSGWLKDARALELEVRQASGQAVSPDAQPDEELKLLALRGLMQSDPDRALPMIETLLGGSSSIRIKENALFLLSQSRAPQARALIAGVARGASNPDLQLRAIRYLGAFGGAANQQLLDEAYRASSDPAVKRAVLQSLMLSGDRARLSALARSEPSADLRGQAIQQLGVMRAAAELTGLYRAEQSIDVKKKIVQGLFIGGSASALVDLARAEQNIELKRDIVSKLSMMRSKEATDFLLELLK